MNKDKEPEQLASIALSREEIASRQRTAGKLKTPTSNATSTGAPKVLWALSVFSLVFCVALLVELYSVKQQSDLQLQALTILQEKLTSTDEQANLSVDAVKILLREQDHEIRKLWDLANKRNKVDISKNADRLNDQSKVLTKQAGKIDLLNKEQDKTEKLLSSVSASNKQTLDSIKAIKGDLEQSKTNVLLLETKLDSGLSGLPKNVGKTLEDHDKGIKAMDATRLQLMRRIQALEKEIKALKAPAPAAQP
jgi:chromosome segregation ATPase